MNGMKLTEASEWLLRLREENVSAADVSAWLDWCSASGENLEAFERAKTLHARLQNVDERTRARFLELGAARQELRLVPLGLAAGLLVALGLLIWKPWESIGVANEQREYLTERGLQREFLLADGTKLMLGSASNVSSAFSSKTRRVELRDGEAYFQVEPDRNRPFVVHAGTVIVTAVGTAFNVRKTADRAVVSVTEGSVDVLPIDERSGQSSGARANAPVRVQAGQQAAHAMAASGIVVTSIEPEATTGWLSGRREYMVEPLGSVIDDVNRYSPRPIVLADPRLRELVFTGTVFQHRINEWVLALDGVFPVRVITLQDGRIAIEARDKNFR